MTFDAKEALSSVLHERLHGWSVPSSDEFAFGCHSVALTVDFFRSSLRAFMAAFHFASLYSIRLDDVSSHSCFDSLHEFQKSEAHDQRRIPITSHD